MFAKTYNVMLQRLLGDQDNDGLVLESSSSLPAVLVGSEAKDHDVSGAPPGRAAPLALGHFKDYGEYRHIDHTHLTRNNVLAHVVTLWLKEFFRLLDQAEPSAERTRSASRRSS